MINLNRLQNLFRKIDGKDARGFVAFLSDDARFIFGNAPPVVGKQAILKAVEDFFNSVESLRHELLETWIRPDAVICRGVVTYTRHDSTRIRVPFANILKMKGALIRDYQIYIDASEFSRI